MKFAFLLLLATAFIAAGMLHFIHPRFYLKIMPPWLPWHRELVFISGIFEILFGLLLLPAATRIYGVWGIIVLLIVVFPANIQMAINYANKNNPYLWAAILRLPLQLLLIWWAYQYTK